MSEAVQHLFEQPLARFIAQIIAMIVASRLVAVVIRRLAQPMVMNTRGLMELIVLNIGLGMGVISPTVFSMMVIMALVTTCIASPLVRRFPPSG